MSLSPATKNKCQAAKILNDLISFDSEDEEEDLCTSEINAASLSSSSKPLLDSSSSSSLISSFRYSLEEENLTKKVISKVAVFDEDGDLVRDNDEDDDKFIEIEHKIQSTLAEVGFQVWRGSLFMADFVLQYKELFQDKTVLEIGAGTGNILTVSRKNKCLFSKFDLTDFFHFLGISSIVISKHCNPKEIIVTDLDILMDTLKKNLQRNKVNFENTKLEVLDVNAYESSAIFPKLPSFNVILGADVIYSKDITDGIFNVISKYSLDNSANNDPDFDKKLYFAIDKRYIFTLDALETVAPAYEYFMSKIDELRAWKKLTVSIYEESEIEQAFCYERSKDLVVVSVQIH